MYFWGAKTRFFSCHIVISAQIEYIQDSNKMKEKKIKKNIGTAPKSNKKIVEIYHIDTVK